MQPTWLAFVDDFYDNLEPRYPRLRGEETGHALSAAVRPIGSGTPVAAATRDFSPPT